jgi:two-component sensor histidine kinase
MVFHELATNAAKHGALTLGSGSVNVSWTRKDEYLLLHWQENGGPQIMAAPIRKGFGSTLTHNTIVREFGGTLDYDWRPDGLSVDINVPIQNLST